GITGRIEVGAVVLFVIMGLIMCGTGYLLGRVVAEDRQLEEYEMRMMLKERRRFEEQDDEEERYIFELAEKAEEKRMAADQKKLAKEVKKYADQKKTS
ncbi:MAG: hypothetical protein Q4B15_08540, partial [Lachnospiraceae bacterium]|nr:hypothetical protein [Lachnospiraceae bacterium]